MGIRWLLAIHLTSCSFRVPSTRWHTNRLSSDWFSSLVSKWSYHSYYCHPNWLLQLHFIRLDGFIAIIVERKIYLLFHRVDFASRVPESFCIRLLCPSRNCTHTGIHLRKRPARAALFPISWQRTGTGVPPDSIAHLQTHDPASTHHWPDPVNTMSPLWWTCPSTNGCCYSHPISIRPSHRWTWNQCYCYCCCC